MSAATVPRREAWGFAEVVVFVAGISTLGAEIAAARLVAPAFGASTVVWANTIAVVLVALAIGYAVGGRFADRHPHARGLALAALLGAALIALIPLLAIPLLGATDDSLGEFSGSLVAQLVLVLPPVIVLGALSPWAIRLRMKLGRRGGGHHRAAVRARHRRRARRQLRGDAGADPVGGYALDLPVVRGPVGRGVRTGGMVLQACLNGDRETGVPRAPEELAADARACVAAGAVSLHVHPRDPDGHETLDPVHIAAAVRALRAAAPRVELSLSTGLWITSGDVDARARAIADWTERPDLVSLNLSEDGWRELADQLAERGIGIEAGVWTARDARRCWPRAGSSQCGVAAPAARATTHRCIGSSSSRARRTATRRSRSPRRSTPSSTPPRSRPPGCTTASGRRPGRCSTPPSRSAARSGSAWRTC